MGLIGNGRPDVRTLANRGDAAALVEAASFHEVAHTDDGETADRGAPVREAAILALGALGSDVGEEAALSALTDRADRVRVAAIRVLYARKAAGALAEALGRLPSGDGYSRPLAFQALVQLNRAETAPVVADALVRASGDAPLEDEDTTLLSTLLAADEGFDITNAVIEKLVSALSDPRDVVADRASDLLALLAPASTEAVIAELRDGGAPHRAASVLGRVKEIRAMEPLKQGLGHGDPRVRAESAAALGELRDPATVEALVEATADPDHRVRSQASRALDVLGSAAVVIGVATLVRPMLSEPRRATRR
jgi:HEAT repeat protein